MSDPATARPSRALLIAVICVGALVAIGVAVGIALLIQGNAAKEQDAHDRRIKACEMQYEDPYGEDLDAMLSCVDSLMD